MITKKSFCRLCCACCAIEVDVDGDRVVEVRANRVVVRPLTDETPSPSAKDPLRRPIDSIADDPFEEEPPG